MREGTPILRQETMTLPHFEHEVRAIYVADCEAPYLPVIDLCNMLGLRADTHLPRWRKLFLWGNARKLAVHTPKGRRVMWCLHMGALLGWYCAFSWDSVRPERREQLQRSSDAWLDASEQAQKEMVARYRTTRRMLFEILTTYAASDTTFSQLALLMQRHLIDADLRTQWAALVVRGKVCIDQVTTCARQMLQEQSSIPIMNVMRRRLTGSEEESIDEFSLPLFPIVQEKELAILFDHLGDLTVWHQHVEQFLANHELPPSL